MCYSFRRGELVELTNSVEGFEGHYSRVENNSRFVIVIEDVAEDDIEKLAMVQVFGMLRSELRRFYVTPARLTKL
jgi:hypothetical protein